MATYFRPHLVDSKLRYLTLRGLIAKFFAPSALNIFELRYAKTGAMKYLFRSMKVLKVLYDTEEPLYNLLHQFVNFQTSGGGGIQIALRGLVVPLGLRGRRILQLGLVTSTILSCSTTSQEWVLSYSQ